jgi:hypothetical protein
MVRLTYKRSCVKIKYIRWGLRLPGEQNVKDTVLKWLQSNVQDGANLAEFEELISGDLIDGIDSKDKALELLYNNRLLKAAFDSEISKKIENHDNRFKEEKLPSLLDEARESLRRELNPKETEEQKEIREMREQLKELKAKEQRANLERTLISKAKELNYDPERAAKLAILGDDAEKFMQDEAAFHQKALESQKEQLINGALAGKPPTGGESLPSDLTPEKIDGMSVAEIEAMLK